MNAGWIIGCKIIQSLVNLVIGMISARYLGPSNYGLISYAASVVAFVLPLMQLGLTKTLVLEFLERPQEEGSVLGTAIFLNFLSAVACMVGVFVYLYYANPGEPTTVTVGVLFSISLLFQAFEITQYWFQAKLLSKYTSIASLVAYCLVALYKIFLLVSGKPVTWFAVSNSIDVFLIAAILLFSYRKIGRSKLRISMPLGKKMLHRSKHYIVSTMMVTIFTQTDRIMLKQMIGETETGYYSAAISCVGITAFVFAAIIDSMRPVILEEKGKSALRFEKSVTQLYCVITYCALAQCVVMTVFAKPIVLLLYGAKYVMSIVPLRIAVWYSTFSYYGSVRNIWILAEGKQRYLWIINLSGAIANVVLNLILIPYYGAVGAAVASLITQFFTNVVIGYILSPIRDNNRLLLMGLNPAIMIQTCRAFIHKQKNTP